MKCGALKNAASFCHFIFFENVYEIFYIQNSRAVYNIYFNNSILFAFGFLFAL